MRRRKDSISTIHGAASVASRLRQVQHILLTMLGAIWICGACASAPSPPSQPDKPDWYAIGTKVDCARARVACGGTRCVAQVDNGCGTPVTCRLTMTALCEAQTGEAGPATGASGPMTVPGGRRGQVEAEVVCDESEVRLTQPNALKCFR